MEIDGCLFSVRTLLLKALCVRCVCMNVLGGIGSTSKPRPIVVVFGVGLESPGLFLELQLGAIVSL